MERTIKLYDADSHMRSFTARVISCTKEGEIYDILLDRTAFFPEGGGQTSDTGRIGEIPIADVRIEDGVIHHYSSPCSALPPHVGEECECALDFEERFRKMQHHSGEHIVSGIVHSLFGYDNVGFHLGSDVVTMDFNGSFSREELRNVELLANRAVCENRRVTAEYPSRERLAEMSYRSKLDLKDDVRIVTIDGIDACACCAPHVSATGEIGMIKLCDAVKNKGGTRITLLCGLAALEDYDARCEIMYGIAKKLSTSQSELGAAFDRLEGEISELKDKNYRLRSTVLEYKLAETAPTDGDICFFEEELTESDMRRMMNGGLERCGGISAVFVGGDETGYSFSAASDKVDMRAFCERMRSLLGAKCGGSEKMIRGSVKRSKKEIMDLFDQRS